MNTTDMLFSKTIISEEELANLSFSERDALFVTTSMQVDYLKCRANASLNQGWLCPLSTQAYARILRLGHPKVRSYFEFIDFVECKRWYHEGALNYSRTWLRELGLEFRVEGIDIAELDAANQFLLFLHARYIERTAERLIRASPQIETFYVVVAEERLPQDFYFDSDVSSAVLQFLCERLGCRVRTILMKQRPTYVFPQFQRRPIMESRDHPFIPDPSTRAVFRSSRRRVGFVPATIPYYQKILDSTRELGCQTVFFPSTWEVRDFSSGRKAGNEYLFRLSAADGEWSVAAGAQLADLRNRLFERRARSTLPACIIRNPYLDFQIDYVITRRWLAYVNMIRRAVPFVSQMPLDLFIHSDHFTAEGAVLARLYRRRGTQIVAMLHSGWPCDRNWTFYDSSDSAMVPSKTCADKLRQLSGMSEIFVAAELSTRSYRSLVEATALSDLLAEKRRAAGDRKIVLLVTNSLELDCVPFTDLKSHFQTISTLARIPESLKGRVLVAIRTKPGIFGEDPILYPELCELPPEDLNLLDGLSFSQSIQVADCIVGINIPTSGYFEILEKGGPLIHVQTADVTSAQPDLPPEVIGRISEPEGIWPAIEAVLFDERQRQKVIQIQRQFATLDCEPEISNTKDLIKDLIQQMLDSRSSRSLSTLLNGFRQGLVNWFGGAPHRARRLDSSCLPQCQQGGTGYVDDVLLGPGGIGVIVGWAADLVMRRPAKAIHVFLNGLWILESSPGQSRPDVAAAYNDGRLEYSGFSIRLLLEGEAQIEALSVYSELHDGTFFELRSSSPNRWPFPPKSA